MLKYERMLNTITVDGQEIVVGDNALLPIDDLRMATADVEFNFSDLESDDFEIDPENAELLAFDSRRFLLKLDRIEDNIKNDRSWSDGIRFNLCAGLAPQDELQILLYFYYVQDENIRKRIYSSIEKFISRCGDFDFDPNECEVDDLIAHHPENPKEITTPAAYRLLYAFEKKAYETGEDQYYEKMLEYERHIKD